VLSSGIARPPLSLANAQGGRLYRGDITADLNAEDDTGVSSAAAGLWRRSSNAPP
jgi:hypothetical protein